jgi:hypothetical protein
MPATAPQKITLRAYPVGFGDCFLLSFGYTSGDRHGLIDFGSTGLPKQAPKGLMKQIAADIKKACGGQLHVVVATHRHKDHISGFATTGGPGKVIAACKPKVVIQPWTEDPKAQPDAEEATNATGRKAFTRSLIGMQRVATGVHAEALQLASLRAPGLRVGQGLVKELTFLGDDNDLKNRSAIENLMTMGERHVYANYGSKLGLRSVLPGVKVRVLGPPTLKQSKAIRKERARDPDEFWHLMGLSASHFGGGGKLFAPSARHAGQFPAHVRWLRGKLLSLRGQQLLSIVRALDGAMNNTSLILLFEVGDYRLLFPGDAQIENWSYALKGAKDKAAVRTLLRSVNLYKVGHHGSLNATPKTMWGLFKNKSEKESKKRLQTVVSTMPGKHGSATKGTEVPRKVLVNELCKLSDFYTTEVLTKTKASPQILEIDLAANTVAATPARKPCKTSG